MKLRLLLVAVMTTVLSLFMVGSAFACSNACPDRKGMNCVQVCFPDLW